MENNGAIKHHMKGASVHRGGAWRSAGHFRPRAPSCFEASVVDMFLEPVDASSLLLFPYARYSFTLCREGHDRPIFSFDPSMHISVHRNIITSGH